MRMIVTSSSSDALNTNAAIRKYIAQGLRDWGGDRAEIVEMTLGALTRPIGKLREADLVLAVGSLAVDSSDHLGLRRAADRCGAALAIWLHDDPYEIDYAYKLRDIADLVFTNDRWSAAHYGEMPVAHLPLAACSHTHYRPIPDGRRDTVAFFCGHAYDNRIAFVREAASILRRHRTYICGENWPADLGFAHNHRLTPKGFADTAARSMFTLNIGRDLNVANRRFDLVASTPGPRTFEVALMGSAQLFVGDGLEILEYFDADQEIVLIDGVRDLEMWLERAADDPTSIVAIAKRAQSRAFAEHTYRHRGARIVSELRAHGLLAPEPAPFGVNVHRLAAE